MQALVPKTLQKRGISSINGPAGLPRNGGYGN